MAVQVASLRPGEYDEPIQVCVSRKGDIRDWSNDEEAGLLFKFEGYDHTGKIYVTAYREEVNRFYGLIKVNRVYRIRGFKCNPVRKEFRSESNRYELVLNGFSRIERATDTNFVSIADIDETDVGTLVDVRAVVEYCNDLEYVNRGSDNKRLAKRDVLLVDDSEAEITLTLWEDVAMRAQIKPKQMIQIMSARVTLVDNCLKLSAGLESALRGVVLR